MKKIKVIDMTLIHGAKSLSFKEKIEIARQLDKLNCDGIDLPEIENVTTDSLLVKTIASFVKNSTISVSAGMSVQSIEAAVAAAKSAKRARIKICIPVSAVKMEYVCHKKPAKILELAKELFETATAQAENVEFFAEDATRAELDFLSQIIGLAVEAGIKTVTLSDEEGAMLPDEFADFLKNVRAAIPALEKITLGVLCKNTSGMATASAVMAIKADVDEIRCLVGNDELPRMNVLANIIHNSGARIGIESGLKFTELTRITKQIEWVLASSDKGENLEITTAKSDDVSFDANDTMETIIKAVNALGYELSSEDYQKVYDEFKRLADHKTVSSKEIDAIVANVALQVPPTYQLVDYVINNGNIIAASAQIALEKEGKKLAGISMGDGPVDASFKALEQIIGHHFELDDFQIQSVTKGREAVGQALVRLRHNGKVYSGSGISTDIIGSSIRAYINAVNKIVYEEN